MEFKHVVKALCQIRALEHYGLLYDAVGTPSINQFKAFLCEIKTAAVCS